MWYVCICTDMQRPEIEFRCPPRLVSTLYVEAGSFTEPRARCVCWSAGPAGSLDSLSLPPVHQDCRWAATSAWSWSLCGKPVTCQVTAPAPKGFVLVFIL